jgi:aquaporin Z
MFEAQEAADFRACFGCCLLVCRLLAASPVTADLPDRRMPSPARQLHDRRTKPRLEVGMYSREAYLPLSGALARHWPEYLIEALFLMAFVVLAGIVAALLETPGGVLRNALPDAITRRVLNGLVMGAIVAALIYSPWGRRSGTHLNPAMTLAFFRLRKIGRWDLLFYLVAQFAGGAAGIAIARALMGPEFAAISASGITIQRSLSSEAIAFFAEATIAGWMMLVVLVATNHATWYRWAGLIYGLMIAMIVSFASPLSAFGMNPARTVATTLSDGSWDIAWLALVAPILGMQLAVDAYRLLTGRTQVLCAKLAHNVEGHCIFKCQHPDQARSMALQAFEQKRPQRGS